MICAAPRSGTKYTANVLTQGGLPCTHEICFHHQLTPDTSKADIAQVVQQLRERPEVSWMSVPWIDHIRRAGIPVYLQVRNPWRTLCSIIHSTELGIPDSYRVGSKFAHRLFPPDYPCRYSWALDFLARWYQTSLQYVTAVFHIEDGLTKPVSDYSIPVPDLMRGLGRVNTATNHRDDYIFESPNEIWSNVLAPDDNIARAFNYLKALANQWNYPNEDH